jgi:hypothetical protein
VEKSTTVKKQDVKVSSMRTVFFFLWPRMENELWFLEIFMVKKLAKILNFEY